MVDGNNNYEIDFLNIKLIKKTVHVYKLDLESYKLIHSLDTFKKRCSIESGATRKHL